MYIFIPKPKVALIVNTEFRGPIGTRYTAFRDRMEYCFERWNHNLTIRVVKPPSNMYFGLLGFFEELWISTRKTENGFYSVPHLPRPISAFRSRCGIDWHFFFETWNRNITIRAVKVLKKDASFFLGFFEDYVYFYPETGSDANCQYRFSLPFTYKL